MIKTPMKITITPPKTAKMLVGSEKSAPNTLSLNIYVTTKVKNATVIAIAKGELSSKTNLGFLFWSLKTNGGVYW